jgi:hypothetical protein
MDDLAAAQHAEWSEYRIPSEALAYLFAPAIQPVVPLKSWKTELTPIETATLIGLIDALRAEYANSRIGMLGQFFRVDLRGFPALGGAGVKRIRLYVGHRQKCWVGLETHLGMSWSFRWDPWASSTESIVLSALHPALSQTLEFTMTAIWRDMCLVGEGGFPFDSARGGRVGVAPRLWGSDSDWETIAHQIDHTLDGALDEFGQVRGAIQGEDVIQNAVSRLHPPVAATGLATAMAWIEWLPSRPQV